MNTVYAVYRMNTIQSADIDVYAPSPSSTHRSKDVSSRTLKKRESDRRCQRIKRERTKSKIAALEERVRNFGDQDSTGQVQLLMQQLENVERERDDLAKKVKTIESVIRDGGIDTSPEKKTKSTTHDNTASSFPSPSPAGGFGHDSGDTLGQSYSNERKLDTIGTGTQGQTDKALAYKTKFSDNAINTIKNASSSINSAINEAYSAEIEAIPEANTYSSHPQPEQPCECCSVSSSDPEGSQFNTWRFTNQMLSSRFSWPAYFQLLQDNYRDDTPVRAVVEGWDAIAARGPMHPSWQILKKMDQVLLQGCSQKERLAVMYAVQLLLMSHVTPDVLPDLPNFYRNRPSQSIADSYAIHFFPWPGMRERFVFNQHRYCTNDFWRTFIPSLRILWPFEFRDCYTKNIETGLYSMSPLFNERVNDINAWAMDYELFIKWPELRADIPMANGIPRSVSNLVPKARLALSSSTQTNSRPKQKTQPRDMATTMPSPQFTQAYIHPGETTPAQYYVSNTVPDPVGAWAETTPQHLQSNLYYPTMPNPIPVTTGF